MAKGKAKKVAERKRKQSEETEAVDAAPASAPATPASEKKSKKSKKDKGEKGEKRKRKEKAAGDDGSGPDDADGAAEKRRRTKAKDADDAVASEPASGLDLLPKVVADRLRARGINDLFAIQKESYGPAKEGFDVVAQARTGFVVPYILPVRLAPATPKELTHAARFVSIAQFRQNSRISSPGGRYFAGGSWWSGNSWAETAVSCAGAHP